MRLNRRPSARLNSKQSKICKWKEGVPPASFSVVGSRGHPFSVTQPYLNPSTAAHPRTRGSVRRASGFVQISVTLSDRDRECKWPMAIKKLTWGAHPLSTITEQEEPDTKGDNCERPEAR
jgi:hypothetical protein